MFPFSFFIFFFFFHICTINHIITLYLSFFIMKKKKKKKKSYLWGIICKLNLLLLLDTYVIPNITFCKIGRYQIIIIFLHSLLFPSSCTTIFIKKKSNKCGLYVLLVRFPGWSEEKSNS